VDLEQPDAAVIAASAADPSLFAVVFDRHFGPRGY
jgi:hypothetical protein